MKLTMKSTLFGNLDLPFPDETNITCKLMGSNTVKQYSYSFFTAMSIYWRGLLTI